MANTSDRLETGKYYHIYNRGINSCRLFECDEDYHRFMLLQEKYIVPVADILAWVLMPNHFHFLIRIKENVRYKYTMEEITAAKTNAVRSIDADRFGEAAADAINKWATVTLPDGINDPSALRGNDVTAEVGGSDASFGITLSGTSTQTGHSRLPQPAKHLSHLFNAYAKYYNTRYNRHGALFERPFRRKLIDSDSYFSQVILYIHNNPRHHGFTSSAVEYSWSSYLDYLNATNVIYSSCVDEYFGDIDNFKVCHQTHKIDDDFLE